MTQYHTDVKQHESMNVLPGHNHGRVDFNATDIWETYYWDCELKLTGVIIDCTAYFIYQRLGL